MERDALRRVVTRLLETAPPTSVWRGRASVSLPCEIILWKQMEKWPTTRRMIANRNGDESRESVSETRCTRDKRSWCKPRKRIFSTTRNVVSICFTRKSTNSAVFMKNYRPRRTWKKHPVEHLLAQPTWLLLSIVSKTFRIIWYNFSCLTRSKNKKFRIFENIHFYKKKIYIYILPNNVKGNLWNIHLHNELATWLLLSIVLRLSSRKFSK